MPVKDPSKNRQYVDNWKQRNYELCVVRHRDYNKKYYTFLRQVKLFYKMYDAML